MKYILFLQQIKINNLFYIILILILFFIKTFILFFLGYFYPGTGSADNLGKRKGYCINIPWNISDYCPGNEEYIYAFERLILPILKNYSPEVILVSAGYDSAKNDPLGNAVLTKDGFWYMT